MAPETTGEMVKNPSCPGWLPINRDKGLTPTQPNPTQPKQKKKEEETTTTTTTTTKKEEASKNTAAQSYWHQRGIRPYMKIHSLRHTEMLVRAAQRVLREW